MNEFFRRLRYLLNRRRFDRELAGDLEFHREMAAGENRPIPRVPAWPPWFLSEPFVEIPGEIPAQGPQLARLCS